MRNIYYPERKMIIAARHLWLLFLPLMAFMSLLLRDSPKLADEKTFSNVNTQFATTNFFELEETLRNLYVVNKNNMIDAQTEKYLSKISNDINFSSNGILLQKTFPTSQGKELLQLISCYRAYKQEEQRISRPYLPLKTNQMLDYRNLQHTFFDKISQSLFAEYDSFYQNAQAAGIQLIVPSQDTVLVPPACAGVHKVE